MCRLVDELIPADLKHCVFGYLDDVCVVSEDFDTHLSVLLRLSEQFRKANLTLNIAKSRFCVTEVQYLGFVIGRGGIATDPSKVDAIRSWPSPKTLKQARRFLGLVGWYRRFIQNFAEVVFPITELLSTKKKFVWTDTAQEAFDKLKDLLTTAPILQNPDFSKPFFVHCDASDFGVGAVLIQLTDEGIEKPVAFMSKKLNTAQRNYSVTERECLSAVLAIEKFRCYLELQEFELITDHASLLWLMRQPNLKAPIIQNFLQDQIFFAYGVPQTIVSDNGPQFKAVEFNAWLTSLGIRHIYTAVYSPQSNASERVNRSLVAGIRAFLEGNHSEWDAHIHAISCALRNATHQSIGCSPYHALYGFDMMTHGTQYELLHKLGMLNESENVLHRDDLLKLLRKQLRDNIAVAHEQQSKQYNLRTREISYKVGQEVFRRNFAQSNFAKQFNAKLCPQWIKSRSSLLLRAKNSPSRLLLLAASSSPPRREKEANPTTAGKSVASFDLAMYSRPF
ncbi:hypothetical protein ACLKA6_014885 [Drosophila palustris]